MSHPSNAAAKVTDNAGNAAAGTPPQDSPLPEAPQDAVDGADQPTSWRHILLRNAFLLSVIAVAFFAGVFAAETVGTYLDRRAHAESETVEDESLLFK